MTPGTAYTPGAIGDAPAAGHRYWPQLDGMRTLAVALVLVGHSWVRHFHGAELGVGLFFALSGFLITGLLMDELGRNGRVDLARFTGRRALRLVPALLVLLAATVPVLRPPSGDVAAALLYYSNWWRAAGHDMGNLGHLWSLAVEEQFYLVWPLILVVAAPRGVLGACSPSPWPSA